MKYQTKLYQTKFIFNLIIFTLILLVSPSRAEFYLRPWKNQTTPYRILSLSPALSFYSTDKNFDANGNLFKPDGLSKYSRMMGDLEGSYGILQNWTAFGRLSWTFVKLNQTTRQTTKYGFPDQALGLNHRLISSQTSGLALNLQFQIDFPLYTNSRSSKDKSPHLGDESADLTGGAFLTIPLSQGLVRVYQITSGGGYTWRTKRFSSSLPWSVFFSTLPKVSGLTAHMGAFGNLSLLTDRHGRTAGDSSQGSGGSYVTDAKNPTLIIAAVEMGYQFKPSSEFSAYYGYSLYGKNSPKGWFVGLKWRLSLGSQADVPPAELFPDEYGKSNKGFVEYSSQAQVIGTNDRLGIIKINKGSQAGLKVGDKLDVFRVSTDGTAEDAIARGKVTHLKEDEAVVKIVEYFKEVWIENGFIVQKPIE